jgi:hypothetical protein
MRFSTDKGSTCFSSTFSQAFSAAFFQGASLGFALFHLFVVVGPEQKQTIMDRDGNVYMAKLAEQVGSSSWGSTE